MSSWVEVEIFSNPDSHGPGGRSRDPTSARYRRFEARRKQRDALLAKIAERDLKIAEARRQASTDRTDVNSVCSELIRLYTTPEELEQHVRVVDIDEVVDNDFSLNVPRYVDTFVPDPHVDIEDAIDALKRATKAAAATRSELATLLEEAGISAW